MPECRRGGIPTRKIVDTEDGAALIVVLIFSTIIIGCSLWALASYKQSVHASTQLLDKLQTRVAAESALQIIEFYGSTGRFSPRSLSVAQVPEEGVTDVLLLNGRKAKWRLHDVDVTVSVRDAGGLLGIMYFSPTTFERLLVVLGASDSQARTIRDSYRDWLDTDSLNRLNGAEANYYHHNARCFFPVRNQILVQSVWELSLLRGMTTELWYRLKQFLVHTPVEGTSVYSMPAEMVVAFFEMDRQQVSEISEYLGDNGQEDENYLEGFTSSKGYDRVGRGVRFPTRVLRVQITAEKGDARDEWQGTIKFKADKRAPYRILSWSEGISEISYN